MTYVIVSGPSDPAHSAGLDDWLNDLADAECVRPFAWGVRSLESTLTVTASYVRRRPGSVLIGRGMAATLIACLAARHPDLDIDAALLLAPADPERPRAGWYGPAAQLPLEPFPFPSILAARRGGGAMAFRRAKLVARMWESAFVGVGPSGSGALPCIGAMNDGPRLLAQLHSLRDLARASGEIAMIPVSSSLDARRAEGCLG